MMFWGILTFFFYLVEAVLWTAPPEYRTPGNIASLILIVLGLLFLAVITRKGQQCVLNGKVGNDRVGGTFYGQFLPPGELFFGLTFSAVIAACLLYLTFSNIPVTQDICGTFWEYAKQLREIQVQNLSIPYVGEK